MKEIVMRVCRKCGVELTESNETRNQGRICHPCQLKDCREKMRIYHKRPEVKLRIQEYVKRPEVKARRNSYQKERSKRPEVKEKLRQYFERPQILVCDAFDKDKPLSFDEIFSRTGGGRGYLHQILKGYIRIGVVEQLPDKKYRINPNNPLRMAMDGYFKEVS